MTYKKISLLLMLPILLGFVSACSCIYFENTEAKLENAEIVFSGTVVELEILESYPVQYRAHIEVEKYWKNIDNLEKQIIVSSIQNDGANCGYNFEKEKKYIIYAYIEQETGNIETNSCMGNTQEDEQTFNKEEQDLDELTSTKTPDEPAPKKGLFSKIWSWIKGLFN